MLGSNAPSPMMAATAWDILSLEVLGLYFKEIWSDACIVGGGEVQIHGMCLLCIEFGDSNHNWYV